MLYQKTIYIILLIAAAVIGIVSSTYIMRHRHTPAGKTLALGLSAGTGYIVIRTLQLVSTDISTKIFWASTIYVIVLIIVVAFFVFALQYTGREKWVTRRNLALLSIISLTILLLAFISDSQHNWDRYSISEQNGLKLLQSKHGPWFWGYAVYTFILALSADFLLIHMLIRMRHLYRRQITFLLVTVFFIQLLGILSWFEMPPLSFLLATIVLFSATCPVAVLSIFRFRIADILPVARGAVIDGMCDGVIVLDPQNRILDVNPLAQQLIRCPHSQLLGQPIQEVWPDWSDQIGFLDNNPNKEIVVTLDEQRIYDVGISPLTDWQGNLVSQIVILHNITERKQAEEKLHQSRLQLKNLFEASKLINSTMNLEKIYTFVADSVQELVGFDTFILFLVSDNNVYPAYTSQKIDNLNTDSNKLVSQCIETAETLLLNDTYKEIIDPGKKSQIIAPLTVENQCVGALHISTDTTIYSQDDADVLNLLSEVVSSAITNAQLHNEITQFNLTLERRVEEKSRRTQIMLTTRQNLQKERNWEKGLTTIVESVNKLGFEWSGVFLVDPVKEMLEFHFGSGVDLSGIGASVSLKNAEHGGVQCVLQKRTIHVPSFNNRSESSFVWVPIIVQNEAFAVLAASSAKKRIADNVKDLEILAGMCGAFIDKTRTVIEPVVENTLKTKIKHTLDPMEGYIVLEKTPIKSFDIFVDLVTHGISGFVVSREYPEKLKEKYKLLKTPILWLSRSEQENTINPDDLPKLSFIIEDFTRKTTESVILLDGLEYLVAQIEFETVLKYLHGLKDKILLNNSRLIIPLNKETLSLKEFNLLEREFTIVEPDMYLFNFLK